jgi:hypothetical protein
MSPKVFSQRPGVEYHETYAPTGRTAILQALFALAAHYRWEIWGFDVSTAFLDGKLNKELYMQPPPGHDTGPEIVWRLHHALYGLKQAAHQWWRTFADAIEGISFSPLTADPAVYIRLMGDDPDSIVLAHVDDGLCFGPPGRSQAATQDILQLFPG